MRHNLVVYRFVQDFLCGSKYVTKTWQNHALHFNAALHNCSELSDERSLPLEWYRDAFPRLAKLTNLLKNVDLVDGRLLDINDNSVVTDERLLRRMHKFKTLARTFIGHPSIQEELMKNVKAAVAGRERTPPVCFAKPIERNPMTVDTLTKVCNFLNISAQQRKTIRLAICSQVTQHRIWTGALQEILKRLIIEMKLLDCHSPSKEMLLGRQIVSTCLKFLAKTANSHDEENACSWMRPKPSKPAYSAATRDWGEVLEMINDLIDCLKDEKGISYHVSKLEAMKEGLNQIKDVLIDRDIGYKEVQHAESLVQRKLLTILGHSSPCLFTLLRYYLHRTIRDMEVEVSGGLCEIGSKDKLCLYMGKILTSVDEKMIWRGVKQLDRALDLFKFVWETAKIEGRLEVQGHLWCVGAESRTLTYRGNLFIIHGINL